MYVQTRQSQDSTDPAQILLRLNEFACVSSACRSKDLVLHVGLLEDGFHPAKYGEGITLPRTRINQDQYLKNKERLLNMGTFRTY